MGAAASGADGAAAAGGVSVSFRSSQVSVVQQRPVCLCLRWPLQDELAVVWLLLIAVVVVTYLIQRHRFTLLPPSSSAMLLGILAGVISRIAGLSKPLRFSPAAFFYALLPPIVFAAGFTLKKKSFFKNFGPILMFAVRATRGRARPAGGAGGRPPLRPSPSPLPARGVCLGTAQATGLFVNLWCGAPLHRCWGRSSARWCLGWAPTCST